jgi:hypothetical protein
MTTKKILEGLKLRLKMLEDGYQCIEKQDGLEFIKADYVSKIDEVESIIHWIERKSGN